ncbi:fasciclin domain-containing protein [Altererythrobacter aquiaggeris]|uniref:fasciclin domain-containing protein n=1 Tax=Aestuarierythrobacter aquiaggeris TaxID=1898396 RepID=UPI00301B068A
MRYSIPMKLLAAGSALALGGCMTMEGDMNDDMATATSTTTVAYPTVGGAKMYPTYNIVQNAQNSPIHTTLVKAVVAADLAATLSSAGPFTVFAPTDEAFGRMPAATLNTLLMPANKAALQKVLTYHVVPGRVTAADLVAKIKAGGGTTTITTVQGGTLTASMVGGDVKLAGQNGSLGYVKQADVMQSNGIIHVVNGVLLPSM